jgi:uncharacterized protein YjiS (DUF1127 family)
LQALQIGHAKPSIQSALGSTIYGWNETMEGKMNPLKTFRAWRRYNETVRELNRLNTRQLADLGINRGDIERVARGAA